MGVAHRLEVRCFYLDTEKVLDLNLKTKPPCPTIIPFTPQPHCQMGINIIPIFQMRKLRFGQVKQLAQHHFTILLASTSHQRS